MSKVVESGRSKDVYLLDYTTIGGMNSNTWNPFAFGTSNDLVELLTSLMDGNSIYSSNDIWFGKMQSLLHAIMSYLVYKRDNFGQKIDSVLIRKCLDLSEMIKISKIKDLPLEVAVIINSYLKGLPGYLPDGDVQCEIAKDQHDYLQKMLVRLLCLYWSDTYGHILLSNSSEIDLRDIIKNGKILFVKMPDLEKSTKEMALLGQLVLASLKCALNHELNNEKVSRIILNNFVNYNIRNLYWMLKGLNKNRIQLLLSSNDGNKFESMGVLESSEILKECDRVIIMGVTDRIYCERLLSRLPHFLGFRNKEEIVEYVRGLSSAYYMSIGASCMLTSSGAYMLNMISVENI